MAPAAKPAKHRGKGNRRGQRARSRTRSDKAPTQRCANAARGAQKAGVPSAWKNRRMPTPKHTASQGNSRRCSISRAKARGQPAVPVHKAPVDAGLQAGAATPRPAPRRADPANFWRLSAAASVRLNAGAVYMLDDRHASAQPLRRTGGTRALRRSQHRSAQAQCSHASPSRFSCPMTVVTRFAPSPTGFLHIGGGAHGAVQLALCQAARRQDAAAHRGHGPRALDRGRHRGDPRRPDLARPRWDGDVGLPVRARRPAPRGGREPACAAARPITATPRQQELEEMREQARAEGRPMRYDGRWRDRDPSEAPAGVKPVIRLKAPQEGETVVEDRSRAASSGRTRISTISSCCARTARRPTCSPSWWTTTTWASPTSSAATITSPTPPARRRSTRRCGWDVPSMAHIPLIHGPDGAKLSKRHGALGVEAYRAHGLPARTRLRNYLVRLGWSHGDQEIFSTEEMIAAFDLGSIGRSPARFDFAKLENLNGHYMRQPDDEELVRRLSRHRCPRSDRRARPRPHASTPALRAKLARRHAGPEGARQDAGRAPRQRLLPLRRSGRCRSTRRPRRCSADGRAATRRPRRRSWKPFRDWTAPSVGGGGARACGGERALKLGQVAQPLRAALTGRATSPGMFDVMAVLGRDESLVAACATRLAMRRLHSGVARLWSACPIRYG